MINNNSGFTLVEFLIATVILMVGLLGMLQGINIAMEKNIGNVVRNEAYLVADDNMMNQRNLQFDSLFAKVSSARLQRYARGIFKNYSVKTTVSLATASSKEIRVDVSWSHRNQRYSHSVSSFVSSAPK
ncbi:MAG: prepilin-type N-terminal cleavage/methylation domain-containing protein [Desulfuromonadales bacterium]